jgi:spore coat protein U-like protein
VHDTGTAAKLYGGSTRKMLNGVNELNYQVYTDAGHTAALGSNATAGAAVTADGTAQAISLYGQTTAGQGILPSGSYLQALALTVEF